MQKVSVHWEIKDSDTCQYFLDKNISSQSVNYTDSQTAGRSPLAAKIFGFPWTKAVEVAPQHVIVAKHDWVEWDVLAEPLAGLIKEHISERGERVEENPELKTAAEIHHPLAEPLTALLENEINPQVASHGGYIRLMDVKENKVYISMEGGCQGCSQSQATLKEGVATTIKKYFPQVADVIDMTNHAHGENPYYT